MLHCKYLSLAILILVWLPATALASDYQIPGIEIEVEISEDGTLSVNEHRTYVFDGAFSWADYRLREQALMKSPISGYLKTDTHTSTITVNRRRRSLFQKPAGM
jgi:hypothetical protein